MSSSDPVVLNYNKHSLLRQSDVYLLDGPHWLNDNIITFCFEYLENAVYKDYKDMFGFVCPVTVQYLKFVDMEDVKSTIESLELHKKQYVFFPLNDCSAQTVTGGTHWSLLVYNARTNTFQHYDSFPFSFNLSVAESLAKVLSIFLRDSSKFAQHPIIEKMACTQQNNTYDCGMHVICNTNGLCQKYIQDDTRLLTEIVPSDIISSSRDYLKELINSLKRCTKSRESMEADISEKTNKKQYVPGPEEITKVYKVFANRYIRFMTPEIAAVYKTAFEDAINASKETEAMKAASPEINAAVTTTSLSSAFDAKFLPKPRSWSCPECYVRNSGDKLLCACCETKKPGSQTSVTPVVATTSATTSPLSAKGFGATLLPKPGSWTCPTCCVPNSGDKLLCACCETKKPGSQTSTVTSASPTVTTMSVTSDFGGKTFQTSANSGDFKFGFPTSSSSNVFSPVAATTDNSEKNVFGGFTFTTNPVIQEAEAPGVKDREILLVSTKAKNGSQVTKVNPPITSPFLGFSFKTPSVTTAASSTQSSTTTSNSPFSGFSFKPSPVSFTTSASQSQPTIISTTVAAANISISTIQTSMQNVSPAFVFSKDPNKEVTPANETKSAASDSDVPGSAFTNASSDTSKSAGEFVFGMKPIAQPTTFTFGLSGLSTKPNETFSISGSAHSVFDTTTGFKAPFSITSNAPSVFGGATQKVSDKPAETSSNASIFGGVPTKTDSQISPVFGESQKTETSQNASIFGGIAQKPEAKTNLSSIFGEAVETESAVSIFNKSTSSTENKPLIGGLTEKSETTKSAPIPFGTIQKPETSISAASTNDVMNSDLAE